MRENALEHTKETMVAFLRAFLTNYDNYKTVCATDFSGTAVFVESPYELRSWPMIVLSGGTGPMVTTGLSDLATEIYNEDHSSVIGYRYAGIYQFNIQVDLACRTTVDRDRLIDLVTLAYRLLLRRYLEVRGVLVTGMSYGAQTDTLYNTDKIYLATLTASTWSQWYNDVPFLPLSDVVLNFNS